MPPIDDPEVARLFEAVRSTIQTVSTRAVCFAVAIGFEDATTFVGGSERCPRGTFVPTTKGLMLALLEDAKAEVSGSEGIRHTAPVAPAGPQ